LFLGAQQQNNTVIVYPDAPYYSVVSLFNAEYKIILNGNQTSGLLSIVDILIYNSPGARCQIHTREDETIQVLNGSLQMYMNGYQFCAPAGTTVYIPRNVTQSQRNTGSKAVHTQLLFSPAGLENYLYQIIPLLSQLPLNKTQIAEIAGERGLIFCPEIEWEDLNCTFSDGVLFSLSFHLKFLIFLLYILISLF
jgi:mannose-6-phosphate isomerase-like protein (cupin superfamily)